MLDIRPNFCIAIPLEHYSKNFYTSEFKFVRIRISFKICKVNLLFILFNSMGDSKIIRVWLSVKKEGVRLI